MSSTTTPQAKAELKKLTSVMAKNIKGATAYKKALADLRDGKRGTKTAAKAAKAEHAEASAAYWSAARKRRALLQAHPGLNGEVS
jgi:hypothetical protein